MKVEWLGGLTEEEKVSFKETFDASVYLRERVINVLEKRLAGVERKGLRAEDYADSNWTHLQAFNNGRLAELCSLIDLFKKEENP